MRLVRSAKRRRGALLAMVAICLIPIFAMVALAVDVGLMAMARSHCQNAADSAALAGVRKLNGDYENGVNGRYADVQPAAEAALRANKVLNRNLYDINPATGLPNGQVETKIGVYLYDEAQQRFKQDFTNPGPEPSRDPNTNSIIAWTLVRSQVSYDFPTIFASRLWNTGSYNIVTKASAVHRPRDIAVVVDFSGSMGFDSILGAPWSGARSRTNNPDKAFPRFGGYSYAWSQSNGNNDAYDMHQRTKPNNRGGRAYSPGNITINPSSADGSFLDAGAIVEDFYTGGPGALTKAWPSSNFPASGDNSADPPALVIPSPGGEANQFQDVPGGDNYLRTGMNGNSSSAYAKSVQELTGTNTNTTPRNLGQSSSDYDFEVFGYSFPGFNANPLEGVPAPGGAKANFLSTLYRGAGSDPLQRDPMDYAGFSQGPRYWGKTFFIWPPDPRKPVNAAPRVVRSGNRWVKNPVQGQLNQWLAELDRNWLMFPNGTPSATGSFNNFPVVAMTRYSAGAYDPLLANWPLDENGARRANFWTRDQVERFLRGLDPNTNDVNRPATLDAPTPYATAGTRRFRVAPVQGGIDYIYAGFYSGPGLNPVTGAPNSQGRYPEVNYNNRPFAGDNSFAVDETNLSVATATAQPDPFGTTLDTVASVPSPLLLGPAEAVPAGAPAGALTQAAKDAQIARLILGLYDNIEADFDWRRRYFYAPAGVAAWPANNRLFTVSNMRAPSSPTGTGTYHVDYDSILYWIKNIGPNPFPESLRCGRVRYYEAIPDTIPVGTSSMSDDQRFWKEYIDFVLHVRQQGAGNANYSDQSANCGFGQDFTIPPPAVNGQPAQTVASSDDVRFHNGSGSLVNPSTNGSGFSRRGAYQNYSDNPPRPKCRLWFGPMTMVDFVINTNLANPFGGQRVGTMIAGACSQSQSISCKLGVRAALLDCKINHPNDNASLIFFSGSDMNAANPKRFRSVRSPLGLKYDRMIDSLFFPLSTIDNPGTEISWNSGEMNEVPNANGGTCYDLPLMLAYNQFSGNSSLLAAHGAAKPRGDAGGLGRKGAQKVVIFETDGVPNTACAVPNLAGSGSENQFYPVRLADNISITGGNNAWDGNNFQGVAAQLAKNIADGGFSRSNKPLLIHAIGFGFLFEPGFQPASEQSGALRALESLQNAGNIVDSEDTSDLFPGSSLASYKVITGDSQERIQKMQKAFTRILQEKTVQVSLVE